MMLKPQDELLVRGRRSWKLHLTVHPNVFVKNHTFFRRLRELNRGTLKLTLPSSFNSTAKSKYVAYSLLPNVGYRNNAPFKVDKSNAGEHIKGFIHRVASVVEVNHVPVYLTHRNARELFAFCDKKARELFDPIDGLDRMRFVDYLATRNSFNQERKHQYLEAYEDIIPDRRESDDVVKQHLKEEWYPEKKFGRTINSRVDRFKVKIAELVHLMEHSVFNNTRGKIVFFKGLVQMLKCINDPVKRDSMPEVLHRHFGGKKYIICTDYSSFEKSFSPHVMRSVEMRVYRWLLRSHRDIYARLKQIMLPNKIKNSYFTAKLRGTRMSGEMNTSLGNSLTNALIMYYICEKKGYELEFGMVEGDDGIFCFTTGQMPCEAEFAELGFSIKIKRPRTFGESEFCGNVVSENSDGTKTLLASPQDFIRQFNWSYNPSASSQSSRHCCNLMYAKAFSYLFSYQRCPVIAPICRQILDRIASDVNIEKVRKLLLSNEFYFEVEIAGLMNAASYSLDYRDLAVTPTIESRLLMESFFGMTLGEQQFHEKYYCANVGTCVYQTTNNVEVQWERGTVRIDSELADPHVFK